MSYKIKSNSQQIQKELQQNAATFLRAMADKIIDIGRPITPASTKNPRLKNDILRQVLGSNLIMKWDKKYAAYQERGRRLDGSRPIKHYTTPGTGAHFAERSVHEAIKHTHEIAKLSGLA